ncbi:MAG TPA: glycosyltransferase family 39 protein [Candidatus Limnocylindrales bacterium]
MIATRTALQERVSPQVAVWLAFGSILALAAVLRLVGLRSRGTWDADQGHDLLVLRDFVQHGQIPLLGPPTSIGDFHHGMLYYVLLAPAAAVSGADPTAVTAWIAIGGIVAVAVTFWLGRAIAGPIAGLVAALLMAVSASAVEESTFIWNPNLIALSSSIALAAAWRAWQSGRAWWWVVAGAAAVVTMHLHVLGVALTPVVAGLLVADLVRRQRDRDRAGVAAIVTAIGWWLVLALASYVPLIVHEATNDASELRAAIAFLTGGGEPATTSLPARIPIVALRVLGWPLTGLITAAPIATLLVASLVMLFTVWRGWFVQPRDPAGDDERAGVRWLGLGLLWTVVALSVGASSLATVVLGLPNDHYHAFADPMVFVLVGVGVAGLVRLGRPADDRVPPRNAGAAADGEATGPTDDATSAIDWPVVLRRAGSIAAAGTVVILVAWNLLHQPPLVAADGGWPAAEIAASRVATAVGSGPIVLDSLPAPKSADALRFPLERLVPPGTVDPSRAEAPVASDVALVILCDQLFHETLGADCGGPAEDQRAAALTAGTTARTLTDRFEAAPGRWISIYAPTT